MSRTKAEAALRGAISLSGDKSLSHRAVMFAALAKGKSVIRGLSQGEDVSSTRGVYRQLGIKIQAEPQQVVIESQGRSGFTTPEPDLNCGNSGTTMRLSAGILAGANITARLTGDASLSRRPMLRIVNPLRQMDANISCENNRGCAPLAIKPAKLQAISYQSPVASAQVKSAILMAGMAAEGQTSVAEPEKSRDHTEKLLAALGCDVTIDGNTVTIQHCEYLHPFEYDVPADTSTAVIIAAAAAVLPGSEVQINNVLLSTTRTGGFEILKAMGASISYENAGERLGEPVGDVVITSSDLTATDSAGVATSAFIDEIPILAVAAAAAAGETRFRDVAELRVKESDRLQGIIDLLKCYNIAAVAEADDLVITGGDIVRVSQPDHRGDHRLAMAAEILNLIAEGKLIGEFAETISISAPEFYPQLRKALR